DRGRKAGGDKKQCTMAVAHDTLLQQGKSGTNPSGSRHIRLSSFVRTGRRNNTPLPVLQRHRRNQWEIVMVGTFLRALAVSGFAIASLTLAASAQDTVRVRGAVERIDGPVYVVNTRVGSEVKLTTVADNPLFVAIVPAKMSDIKP